MTADDQETTGLAGRLARSLGQIGEVVRADDDSVVVAVGPTRASLRVVELGPSFDVVTVIQMVALDVDNTAKLRDAIESRNADLSFGSLRRSAPSARLTDVLMYYTFPVGGLGDDELLAVLHIVLGAGVDARAELSGDSVAD